jgi:hypothetical protein
MRQIKNLSRLIRTFATNVGGSKPTPAAAPKPVDPLKNVVGKKFKIEF